MKIGVFVVLVPIEEPEETLEEDAYTTADDHKMWEDWFVLSDTCEKAIQEVPDDDDVVSVSLLGLIGVDETYHISFDHHH